MRRLSGHLEPGFETSERLRSKPQREAPDRTPLRRQLFMVLSCAALALVVWLVPPVDLSSGVGHDFPAHTLFEIIAGILTVLVFSTVWHTPANAVPSSYLLIACALFSAGWLDLAQSVWVHNTEASTAALVINQGAVLDLTGRLLVALTLAGVGSFPQFGRASGWLRLGIFSSFGAVCSLVVWVSLLHPAALPTIQLGNGSVVGMGVQLRWLIAGLLGLAAWSAYRRSQRSAADVLPLLFGAAAVLGVGALMMDQSVFASDQRNLLGHCYKLLSYGLFYRAMFVQCVNRPYERLSAQIESRRKTDQTLRTQALALDSIVTPVVVADAAGKIVWRNRASLSLLGKRASDVEPGASLFAAPLAPDPVVAERMRATVQVGGVWRGLVHLKDQRGRDITLDQTVTPMRDDSGTVQGFISIAENVTQQEYAELRYKRVIGMATDGFWMASADGRLREVNEAYARMSGYDVAELLSMNVSQLQTAEQAELTRERMERIVQSGNDHFEARHLHKQGHEFTVDVSVLYDPVPQHFYVFVRDRTELVQAAAARKALERQLQQSQKVEQIGQLTGGIAHDFNNILATILGYSRLALERFVPDKQSKLANYLNEVVSASERARDLIAKMLTFAGTHPSIGTEVIAVPPVVQQVVNMMRVSVSSGIQIKTWIEDEVCIRIDPSELSQILVNLIVNARDAIGEHGVIDILVHRTEVDGDTCAASHATLSGTFAAIEVSDSGRGIAEEHMARLFDPFFTTKEVGKGTGLGLSMVQGILRRSGGHVVVKSQLGSGSWFQLLFPLAEPSPEAQRAPALETLAPMGTGQRVWVVDDEPSVARYVGELLEEWGYQVRLFNHPARMLAAFEASEAEVDLVITDQSMPHMSGLELTQRLLELRPELPVILCSGYSNAVSYEDVLQMGIRGYLMKPHNPKELREAVAKELLRPKQ